MQEYIDKLKRGDALSNNATYRSYLKDMRFEIPENLPDAKSLIIIAVSDRLMIVGFHLDGRLHEIMLPPQYYASGLTDEDFRKYISTEVVKGSECKLERTTKVHLKLLAVRSGLGQYGRNNLCYVEGMGSLLKLTAYFTDYQFEKDDWTQMKMMDGCKNCSICMTHCPTKCISKERFVIDVGKCVTLYNEVEGEFPEWIPHDAHNSLVGCMHCQLACPANQEAVKLKGRLGDVTEEETKKILEGEPDEELLTSLTRKLRKFVPAQSKEHFPIFTRNLKALLPRH
ncbi:MAG: hypothetical protein JSV64_03485 [Candidatus Bathyarchaeota archaeon]|nr:MAG: hypothetical protein JSV64_03485 [Candidatus Bathyarchaeota archaeon]